MRLEHFLFLGWFNGGAQQLHRNSVREMMHTCEERVEEREAEIDIKRVRLRQRLWRGL